MDANVSGLTPTVNASRDFASMKLYDAHLPVSYLEDVDIDNLAYFGLRDAVTVFPLDQPWRSENRLLHAVEQHVKLHPERLHAYGIQSRSAIGFTPQTAPERAITQYYKQVERYAANGDIEVIGPLGWEHGEPWEEEIFRRHTHIAAAFDLPIYLVWDSWPERAEQAMDRVLEEFHIDWEQLWFVNVPLSAVQRLAVVGRPMAVAIPPGGIDIKEFRYWFENYRSRAPFAFGSSLNLATVDVTAIARMAQELEESLDTARKDVEFRLSQS